MRLRALLGSVAVLLMVSVMGGTASAATPPAQDPFYTYSGSTPPIAEPTIRALTSGA